MCCGDGECQYDRPCRTRQLASKQASKQTDREAHTHAYLVHELHREMMVRVQGAQVRHGPALLRPVVRDEVAAWG